MVRVDKDRLEDLEGEKTRDFWKQSKGSMDRVANETNAAESKNFDIKAFLMNTTFLERRSDLQPSKPAYHQTRPSLIVDEGFT